MEEKKIVTAEEIMEKVTELGYDVSMEECEEAAEVVNNEVMTAEDEETADLSEDALEDVVGGASVSTILKWLKKMWKNRLGMSPGKISGWESTLIGTAKDLFGKKAAAVATGFFLAY